MTGNFLQKGHGHQSIIIIKSVRQLNSLFKADFAILGKQYNS
jgi:hypothetical protein